MLADECAGVLHPPATVFPFKPMFLTFIRKLVLWYWLMAGSALFAEQEFRDWKNQDAKLKSIEAKLLEYDEAFALDKHSEHYQGWLDRAGIQGETVPSVRLKVRIPEGRNPKKEPARERDYDIPLAVFSQADQDYVLDWDWLRQREAFFERCLKVVLGQPRDIRTERPRTEDGQEPQTLYDQIYLRNGSRKRGVVRNANFSLHNAYGEFVVGKGRLAAIQFGAGDGGRSILTGVNSNRLSGFLDLPGEADVNEPNRLAFETVNGLETVRREEISRIIFHVREQELEGLGGEGSVNLRLSNGDYLDAKVYGGELPMGGRTVPVSQLDRVEVGDGRADVYFKDGGRDSWTFAEEDLPLALDIGPEFKIYHGHLEMMYCAPGFRPLGHLVEAASEREAGISFERDQPGVVRSPSSSSIYHGILEEGDRIVSVDRAVPDFESRDNSFDEAVEDLFDKDAPVPKVEIGVQRGDTQFFQVTIIRKSGADG